MKKSFYFLLTAFAFLNSNLVFSQQWGKYTLYSVMNSSTSVLIDTNNTVIKTWTLPTAYKTGYSAYLLPGGTLLKTVARTGNSFSGGPICGQVVKADWNGNIIWDYVYSTTSYCTHHDICPMPNGNVLLIAYERRSATEATAAGCSLAIEIWPDKIVEIQPTGPTTGTVVWEWKAWDHLVQDVNPNAANYQTSIVNHPELLNINYNTQKDWMHMNGVDYNPILDQITFSCHNLNEIYVIDHSTTTAEAASHSGGNSGKGGDILYRWGNPDVYDASGTQILKVVHDAHWVPEGVPNAGYLAAFNNNGISTSQSAIDQVAPPINGYTYNITPGQAFQPASYTLRHACNGNSSHMGNSQQMPNGNMMVCIAASGSIYEINPQGSSIWTFNAGGQNAKAFRYEECYVNNPAPAIPVITQNGNDLESTPATTYQWYLNGVLIAGATGQTYTPTQSGIYLVRITDAVGCIYQYSNGFHFTSSTGISQNQTPDVVFNIHPNPSTGMIYIDDNTPGQSDFEITVADRSGKILLNNKNLSVLDLSAHTNGIYFIAIRYQEHYAAIEKVLLIK